MAVLKPGDTVRLKSGGPNMTIREVSQFEVLCEWLTTEGKSQTAWFKKGVLDII
jgi:uncharacterized protein YodC (DUF2158 family)